MKTISLLELRNNLGRAIEETNAARESLVVLKNGRPVAVLQPYSHFSASEPEIVREELLRYNEEVGPYATKSIDAGLLKVVGKGKRGGIEEEKEEATAFLSRKHG